MYIEMIELDESETIQWDSFVYSGVMHLLKFLQYNTFNIV